MGEATINNEVGRIIPKFNKCFEVKITPRTFEEVKIWLHTPEDYFESGEKVLSVGEGLSDFARKLHEEGVNSYATDLIYVFGKNATNLDGIDKAVSIYNKNKTSGPLLTTLDNRTRLVPSKFGDAQNGPEIGRIAGADSAKLPFASESMDKVIGNFLMPYVDWKKTIPEFMRVLKPSGEIRLAGVELVLDHERKFIYPDYRRYMNRDLKDVEVSLYNLAKQPNIHIWGFVDQPYFEYYEGPFDQQDPRYAVDNHYIINTLIIRKDDSQPQTIKNIVNKPHKWFPLVGQLIPLKIKRLNSIQKFGEFWFPGSYSVRHRDETGIELL
jgi:SAM-dependent methyltransferase